MFSRLSRYITGSKRRKTKYKPLPEFPPKITLDLSSSSGNRPTSASSGHSSSCSIQPEHAPSFLQVVCNDSRPVYCMETVPFYNPSSLPPGTRKENSLYESAHDEILRERMKVTAVENDAEQDRRRFEGEDDLHLGGVLNRESLRRKARVNSQRCNSLRTSDLKKVDTQRCNSLQHSMKERRYGRQSFDYREREGEAIEYPSMDSYFGPPIYRDPSLARQSFRSQRSQRSQRTMFHDARYLEPEMAPLHDSFLSPPVVLRPNPPVHPGPFRPRPPPNRQEQSPLPPQPHPRVVAADDFLRTSSLRQGPYRDFQYPQPSLSEHNFNPYSHHPDMRSYRDNVPVTKVTRLKQAKTFKREDGMVSDIGIGLGRISGMAASRSVSRRTQSDIGARVRTPLKPLPKSVDKENRAPLSTRASPRTPPQVIKIGKPKGRYKTDRMPVYHLTTPDSDDESDDSRVGVGGFVPLSASALTEVTGDRTSKWLEDVLKCTLSQPPEPVQKKMNVGLERKNTIDVKKHRVFSTTMDIHQKKPVVMERVETRRPGVEGRDEAPSSWIASEIFNTASQAAESQLQTPEKIIAEGKIKNDCFEACGAYDEIDSLMGDYFEDLKERGSDSGDD